MPVSRSETYCHWATNGPSEKVKYIGSRYRRDGLPESGSGQALRFLRISRKGPALDRRASAIDRLAWSYEVPQYLILARVFGANSYSSFQLPYFRSPPYAADRISGSPLRFESQ